ncbi:MAG: DUF305 domain-containing protein [Actinomycetota bacterium]
MLFKKALPIFLASASIVAVAFTANQLGAVPVQSKTVVPMPCGGPSATPELNHSQMMRSMQVQSEFEYLAKMIPHHQEAIATAKLLLAGSQRPEMKKFAEGIIRTQSAEIQQMQAWLKLWYPGQSLQVEYVPMMRELTNLKADELDRAFLEDMRMHHMGAVMMSQHLLNHGLVKHPEVETLAHQISTSQRQEIAQMQGWLQQWFGVAGGRMMGPGMGMGGRFGAPFNGNQK